MSINVTYSEAVATITIARPEKLNALTLQMYQDLGNAFAEINEDDAIRAVVLTGSGERAFCVGADLEESIPALARNQIDISAWNGAHLKGVDFYKPIVAAIDGMCIGGGFELILGTDIRIATPNAVFQFPEVKHGFVPAGGTLVRLVRQIGYAHAMEMLLTARRFNANEMLVRGVINEIVDADQLLMRAQAVAANIASFSPNAVQTIKEAVLTLQDLPFDEAHERESVMGQRTFTSEEAKQGLLRFAERNLNKKKE